MKVNVIGIFGGILALISLALPWWTMSMSYTAYTSFSATVNVYTFQATATALGMTEAFTINLWYGWVALALVLIGGIIGIVVSAKPNKSKLLAIGGALIIIAIVIFALMLQLSLASDLSAEGFPAIGLFGSFSLAGASYTAYLSFGFWLALVAAIVMLVASRKKPAAAVAVPPPPPPTV